MNVKKVVLGCLGAGCLFTGGFFALVAIVTSLGARPPQTETAIAAGEFRVAAMDYDRETDALYFIKESKDDRVPKPDDILVRRDLATGEERVLFSECAGTLRWLSVSRRGSLFVLVHECTGHDDPRAKTSAPPRIVELEGTRVVRSIPVLTNEMLIKRSGREWSSGAIITGCAAAIADSTRQTPLGIESSKWVVDYYSLRVPEVIEALRKSIRFDHVPRYLVLGSRAGPDIAVHVGDCGIGIFQQYHDRLFQQNLSRLNEAVIADTARDPDARIVDKGRDFVLRRAWTAFGRYVYDLGCEGHYSQIVWGRAKLDMGSCSDGIDGFPESYDAFTASGDFIYYRWSGVYRLSKPWMRPRVASANSGSVANHFSGTASLDRGATGCSLCNATSPSERIANRWRPGAAARQRW
jgi:hypothetical protein